MVNNDDKNIALAPLAILVSIIYSLGYHYNLDSHYTTHWLTYYQVINYIRDINTINLVPYLGPLFDYNKTTYFS